MSIFLHEGDCLDALKIMPSDSVDSVVTDPPGGISFMGKVWDSDKGGRDHWITWMTQIAAERLRVIKPGGHALVWALPRTSHWTATAWENAGWEVRDRIAHLFGSGFPKSHNLDGDWKGWGTALKPACEDWWLLRKPLIGKVAENVKAYGTGAMNIDACRIGVDEIKTCAKKGMYGAGSSDKMRELGFRPYVFDNRDIPDSFHIGRWPANVIHDGSDEVLDAFAAFGEKGGGFGVRGGQRQSEYGFGGTMEQVGFGDNARLFNADSPPGLSLIGTVRISVCGAIAVPPTIGRKTVVTE